MHEVLGQTTPKLDYVRIIAWCLQHGITPKHISNESLEWLLGLS